MKQDLMNYLEDKNLYYDKLILELETIKDQLLGRYDIHIIEKRIGEIKMLKEQNRECIEVLS